MPQDEVNKKIMEELEKLEKGEQQNVYEDNSNKKQLNEMDSSAEKLYETLEIAADNAFEDAFTKKWDEDRDSKSFILVKGENEEGYKVTIEQMQ